MNLRDQKNENEISKLKEMSVKYGMSLETLKLIKQKKENQDLTK